MPEKDPVEQALGMDEDEARIAEMFYNGMQAMSATSDRSTQSKEFKVGVSDLGFCSELVRRMLLGVEPDEEPDLLLAWLGTAIGAAAEEAAALVWPDAIRQASVVVPLPGSKQTYNVPGHPDLVLPTEGLMLDAKSAYSLAKAERGGPTRQQQFQRHGYGLGAWKAGLFGGLPLEEVRVGNVWIDRSGIDRRVHVDIEPYDPTVVVEMGEWLDEVVYSYLQTVDGHDTVAPKEPPREMCAVVCGHYESCRAFDTDVTGLLQGEETLAAVAMYLEGAEAEKTGKRLKEAAKVDLANIEGSTGTHTVRWTWVNESQIAPGTRRGYNRLDLRPVKRAK